MGLFDMFDDLFDNDAPPPAPAGLEDAANRNADIAQASLDFSKSQWDETRPRREWEQKTAERVVDANLKNQDQALGLANRQAALGERQFAISEDYYNRYKNTFAPAEDRLLADAEAFDTSAKREQRAGEAGAQVGQAFDAAAANNRRTMQSYGINPNSARFMDVNNTTGLQRAKAVAGAETAARNQVESEGYARRVNAVGLGRNLPANQNAAAGAGAGATGASVGALGAATNMGGGAIYAAGMPGASYRGDMGASAAWMQPAVQANASSANIYSGMWNQALQGYGSYVQGNADKYQFAGKAVGAIAGMASSKKLKKDKAPANEDKVMAGLRKLPVERWKYKDAKHEPDENMTHVGPYAEDFAKTFGVGDGKSISFMDELGVALEAMKNIDKRLAKIESRRAA